MGYVETKYCWFSYSGKIRGTGAQMGSLELGFILWFLSVAWLIASYFFGKVKILLPKVFIPANIHDSVLAVKKHACTKLLI